MPLRRLLPLLTCPLCAVRKGNSPLPLLHNPFTLHCGHTVCSSHLQTLDPTQPCPLPVCSSTPNPNTARPNIPSTSRVIYLPAAPPQPFSQQTATTPIDPPEQRVDITVSKLIEVVSRYSPPPTASELGSSDHIHEEAHHVSPEQSPTPSSDEENEFRIARDMRGSPGRRRRRAPELASQHPIPNHSVSSLQSSSSTVVSADSVGDDLPPSSGHAGSSSISPRTAGGAISDGSDLSPEPPRKRPRCDSRALVTDRHAQPCVIEPETSNSDDSSIPGANRLLPNPPDTEFLQNPRAAGEDSRSSVDKELLTELCCEICFAIYYQPVTTPCQHTFCGRCLQRSLDHKSHCPVCRTDLPDYVYLRDIPQNKIVLAIECEAFPELYAERERLVEEEERNARLDTPLFVCQLSFPGVPTNLHFFEPRYRLMLRRCLESPTPRFGMVIPPKPASGVNMDFGTMLEIRAVKMLPDGRSLVHTWGVSRFRILERGTLDGYMVGRIEYIEDFPEELEDTLDSALEEKAALEAENQNVVQPPTIPPAISRAQTPSARTRTPSTPPPTGLSNAPRLFNSLPEPPLQDMSNEALMTKCCAFVEQLRDGAAPWIVQKLNDSYGDMPSDASNFSFWVALVLPIDEHEKAKLYPIRSVRLRLKLVAHWIDQLNGSWWFSHGCIVC